VCVRDHVRVDVEAYIQTLCCFSCCLKLVESSMDIVVCVVEEKRGLSYIGRRIMSSAYPIHYMYKWV